MFKRLAQRTMLFAILTISAFAAMELAAYLARSEIISARFLPPELMLCLKAAAIVSWGEISSMWFRILMAPRSDVQKAAEVAETEPLSAAIVYVSYQFTWAVRLIAFIALYGVL
jgi:hypothetical protein